MHVQEIFTNFQKVYAAGVPGLHCTMDRYGNIDVQENVANLRKFMKISCTQKFAVLQYMYSFFVHIDFELFTVE